jgi:hypothetical protein
MLAFDVRACNPARGSAHGKKMQAASLHLESICTGRSGTYVEQLDFTGWKGSGIVLRHRVAVYAERRAQS